MLRAVRHADRQRGSRPTGVAGFTILELLMVLAIMGIIAGTAIPNIDNALKAYRADSAARQVLGHLQATRMLALSQNVRYRMLFEADGAGTYEQQKQENGVFTTVVKYELPKQAAFTATVVDAVFAPNGVITIPAPASVTIQGVDGAIGLTRTITVTAAGSMRLDP